MRSFIAGLDPAIHQITTHTKIDGLPGQPSPLIAARPAMTETATPALNSQAVRAVLPVHNDRARPYHAYRNPIIILGEGRRRVCDALGREGLGMVEQISN